MKKTKFIILFNIIQFLVLMNLQINTQRRKQKHENISLFIRI